MINKSAAILLLALLQALLAASSNAATLNPLARLANVAVDSLVSAEQRCLAYEEALRQAYREDARAISRDDLLRSALEVALEDDPSTFTQDAQRVLADVQHCLGANVAVSALEKPILERAHLFALSKAQQESRALPLDQRCKMFEEILRDVLTASDHHHLVSSSGALLFQSVIGELGSRQLPFGNSQPVLSALQECVSKLSTYQSPEVPERTVIAGPLPGPVIPMPENPIEKAREEFDKVKERVKDYGQDLYNGKPSSVPAYTIESEHNQHHQQQHFDHGLDHDHHELEHEHGHEHGLEYEHEHEHDFEHEHELEHEHGRDLEYQHHHIEHYPEQHFGGSHSLDPAAAMASVELQQLNEQLKHQLEAETVRARQLEMELGRERRVKSSLETKLIEVERRLAQAVNRHHDDDDSDDDDDDDDDRKHKKDKKDKKKKKKKGGDDDDDDKIYKDPVDIARKLKDKMNSHESAANRCQKYYMALNHPGKVTKKFVKTLAKLNLPKTSIADPNYYKSLDQYVQMLKKSDNKNSKLAARELEQCLIAHAHQPFATATVAVQHQQMPAAHPVPVIDNRGQPQSRSVQFEHVNKLHPGASEIPVSFVQNNAARGQNGVREWAYSSASASAGGGQVRLPKFPPFPRY